MVTNASFATGYQWFKDGIIIPRKGINEFKKKAQEQCAINIELKVKNLLDEMEFERTNINMGRRVFYNRLQALDLIEEEK